MIKNMGTTDRTIRVTLAALLLLAAFTTGLAATGFYFWVAVILAAIFTVTAIVGTCPLYRVVGLKTCENC